MKGIQSVIAALPLILQRLPALRLIVVGHGPLREVMEALIYAYTTGSRDLALHIVKDGRAVERGPDAESGDDSLSDIARFLSGLTESELDAYFDAARQHVRADSVVFTGYLTHKELRHLFPCCDAAVFPSIVREAGPLVFLEALASGCFPMGTYFGGMKASIDSASTVLPPATSQLMKVDVDNPVGDIASNAPRAIAVEQSHREALARLARDKYDWTSVAEVLRRELGAIAESAA